MADGWGQVCQTPLFVASTPRRLLLVRSAAAIGNKLSKWP